MVKKIFIIGLTAIILSLCCGFSFAADNGNEQSTNLGNEITRSVDKAGESMRNLTDNAFSTNTANNVDRMTDNMREDVTNGMNTVNDGIVNVTGTDAGNYNATRTTTEGTTTTFNTMSTTTWMWIILAVAAIIIIAAIWYYATQNND